MTTKTEAVEIPILGDSKDFRNELKKADKATKQFEKTIAGATKAAKVGFIALGGAIAISVKEFAKFEKSFSNVATLLDKSSFASGDLEKGIEDLKDGIITLGIESGKSFEDLNSGLFDLVSAGVPAEKALATLEVASNLATAGATSTAIAVDGLTSAMGAYGIDASQAQSVAEKFFTAQKNGKTDIEKISKSMGLVAASASAYGVSLDELLASTAAATVGSIKTEAAMTSLKAIISNIAKPTKEAKIEAERLGIEFNATALKSDGLKGFLDKLKGSAELNNDSMSKLFGSTEAVNLAMALTGEGADLFNKTLKDLGDTQQSTTTFSEALALKQATADVAFNKLATTIDAAAVVIGEQFAPAAIEMAEVLAEIVKSIVNMDDDTKESIKTTAKWGTALAIGAGSVALVTKSVAFARGAFIAFNLVLTAGRLKALAFWGAMTGGATLLIGFLPEIIDAFNSFFNDKDELESKANKRADKVRETELQKLDSSLAARERIRHKYSGARLARFDARTATLQKKRDKVAAKELADQNKAQANSKEAKDKANAKAIEDDKAYTEELQALKDEFIKETAAEQLEADALEKEIADQKKEDEKEAIKAHNEEIAGIRANFNMLSVADVENLNEQEKNILLAQGAELKKIEDAANKEALRRQKSANEDKIRAHQQASDELLLIDDIKNAASFQTAKSVAGELARLVSSENSTLKNIGKAAAIVQIGISTFESASKAFSALAWIPGVGPGLGYAAATVITIAGAERISNVQSLAQGGFVKGTSNNPQGKRDAVPTLLEGGEFILPRNISQMLARAGKTESEIFDMFSAGSFQAGGFVGGSLPSSPGGSVATITTPSLATQTQQPRQVSRVSSQTSQEPQKIQLELTMNENLVDFVTVKQRQNEKYGVSR